MHPLMTDKCPISRNPEEVTRRILNAAQSEADRILRPDLGRMARATAAAITSALRTAEFAGSAPSSAPAE